MVCGFPYLSVSTLADAKSKQPDERRPLFRLCPLSATMVTICLLMVSLQAIYFTAYNHLKKDYFKEGVNGKKLGTFILAILPRFRLSGSKGFGETLLAAGIAGMPSAYLTVCCSILFSSSSFSLLRLNIVQTPAE